MIPEETKQWIEKEIEELRKGLMLQGLVPNPKDVEIERLKAQLQAKDAEIAELRARIEQLKKGVYNATPPRDRFQDY